MNDSLIEQRVLKHLALVKLAGCREVCVWSRKGIVTLDGTVPNRTTRLALQKAALTVGGVLAVVNNLRAQPAGSAMMRYASPKRLPVSRVTSPLARRVSGRAVFRRTNETVS
jgi:hypothetical protein